MSVEVGEAKAPYSRAHRALELFGVVSAYTFVALLLWRCARAVLRPYVDGDAEEGHVRLSLAILATLLGYLIADLVSGLVHWAFDRYGSAQTPLLGKNFVAPFRHHHVDPIDITRHDFLETNGNNCLATFIPLLLLIAAPFSYDNHLWLFVVTTLTIGAIATFGTNQFHKWAHDKQAPSTVKWLQRHHIILSREHHRIHHTFPYETHYCITTGWMNDVLVKIRFWSTLERVIERTLGVAAYRDAAPVEIGDEHADDAPAPTHDVVAAPQAG